jgi:hypothetical protein
MLVVKRDGRREPVAFDKITARIKKLCYGFDTNHVDPTVVAQKVVGGVYDGVTTMQLDDLASETAAFLTTQHPDYGRLAARIAVSNLHKQTEKSFSETMYRSPDPLALDQVEHQTRMWSLSDRCSIRPLGTRCTHTWTTRQESPHRSYQTSSSPSSSRTRTD